MAKNQLKDTKVRTAKCPPDKPFVVLNDGENLSLHVMTNGAKLWRYRFGFNGKGGLLSMGQYPAVTLDEARARRDEAARQLAAGQNPSLTRKITKRIANGLGDTLEEIANDMLRVKADRWSPRYLERTTSLLRRDIYPALGHRVLREITVPRTHSDTAPHRRQGRYGAIRESPCSGQLDMEAWRSNWQS